mmetsp:Transcript_23867/g.23545  ORF Transcript_23867/g.23545 Transcript_23867/m.23545 type:complete len:99 (+) Transcript_23867:245-541(+)
MLIEKNQELLQGPKNAMKAYPNVCRLGTTKTNFVNFDELVTLLDRKHEHVMSYISSELGNEASLGPENNLIIQGVIKPRVIEKLYNKYLEHYVKCANC